MKEIKQIIVQSGIYNTPISDQPKQAFVMEGNDIDSLNRNIVNYDDLTQAEKDQWDAFYEMIKSKV